LLAKKGLLGGARIPDEYIKEYFNTILIRNGH
jgi:hypothetical protein